MQGSFLSRWERGATIDYYNTIPKNHPQPLTVTVWMSLCLYIKGAHAKHTGYNINNLNPTGKCSTNDDPPRRVGAGCPHSRIKALLFNRRRPSRALPSRGGAGTLLLLKVSR